MFGERVTGLEQRDVVHAELAHVRETGGGHGARHGRRPYGRGHGHREPGGKPAGGVQLAHRVHDGEVPVSAQGGQREHGHADRHVFGRLRHFAYCQSVRPRRKLLEKVANYWNNINNFKQYYYNDNNNITSLGPRSQMVGMDWTVRGIPNE